MIDLIALVGLFRNLFPVAQEWTEPSVARFDSIDDAKHEPVYQKLEAEGHRFQWVREERLRQLKRNGWEPVYERDAIGRPTIFTDRLEELVLVHRPRSGR